MTAAGREAGGRGGRPLRVLLFSAAHKADAAGVQKVVAELAGHLRAQGHRVIVAWPDGEDGPGEWRLDLELGVGPDGRPGPRAAARGLRDGFGLAARLARFRPDVVNLHYPRGQTLYFAALRRAFGYGLMLSFHNSDLAEASGPVRMRLPRWIAEADAVTAVSADLGAALRALAPDAAPEVIPNGVDTGWWAPARGGDGARDGDGGRDASLAVAAGRLIPMKGFDLLLEAFAAGAPEGARLVIAGEGERLGDLEAQAWRLGIADRTTFAGRLDAAGLRALFHRAGLFVMPSRREGMPLVLIEAMAAGLPAVAAAVNGIPDVLGPGCGALVPPDDVGALAGALRGRLGNAALLGQEGAAARRCAERLDAARTYAAYERALGRCIRDPR